MAKRPIALRLDEALIGRVDVARGDVSRTRWVERALEAALGSKRDEECDGDARSHDRIASPVALPSVDHPASPRTPEPRAKTIADVDPVLKVPRPLPPGVAKGTAGVNSLPFKCRIPTCALRTTSPNATCKSHGGKVVPNE